VDACLYHNWRSEAEIVERLPAAWRDYLGWGHRSPHGPLPTIPILPSTHYANPFGEFVPDADPEAGGPPGSDLDLLRRHHLDRAGIGRAVLCHHLALGVPAFPNSRLAVELTRACNDWTLERWADQDERLYAAIMVCTQLPDEAAAEIRRLGGHPRVAAVLLGTNGLAKPFGHPVYEPIHAAAAEAGLPVIIHAAADTPTDVLSQPVAGGLPGTYTDAYALAAQPLMTHLASLLGQAVLERFADLRVLLAGAGAAWVLPALWRAETEFVALRRTVPWVRRRPGEQLLDSVRVATHPLDRSDPPERMLAYLEATPELASVLCYASGYPSWDADDPAGTAGRLPRAWRRRVLQLNGGALFRWSPTED
jgi:predicted TIM-barrel fold metal-dependent hydrolase